jgi:hypothetical protein
MALITVGRKNRTDPAFEELELIVRRLLRCGARLRLREHRHNPARSQAGDREP